MGWSVSVPETGAVKPTKLEPFSRMNAKAKGTRNERRSVMLIEATGYCCTRSAASLGERHIVGVGSQD